MTFKLNILLVPGAWGDASHSLVSDFGERPDDFA